MNRSTENTMSEHDSAPQLIPLGGEMGAYCDPLTGECVPGPAQESKPTLAVDPVCKMTVDPDTAQYRADYDGQTYYFCAAGCQRAFEQEPEKYAASVEHQDHA